MHHFLDLTIDASVGFDDCVNFSFSLFHKPSFRPNYLAALSGHPNSHKASIFTCEATRILLCCSKNNTYLTCMLDVVGYLSERGYPHFAIPHFDGIKRRAMLDQYASNVFRNRYVKYDDMPCESRHPDRNMQVFFVLPYSTNAKHLQISKKYQQHVRGCVPIDIVLAWSTKPNTSRQLYTLNWPGSVSVWSLNTG